MDRRLWPQLGCERRPSWRFRLWTECKRQWADQIRVFQSHSDRNATADLAQLVEQQAAICCKIAEPI